MDKLPRCQLRIYSWLLDEAVELVEARRLDELKIDIEFSICASLDVAELLPLSLSFGLRYDEPFVVLPFRLFGLFGGELVDGGPFDWEGSFGDTDFAC